MDYQLLWPRLIAFLNRRSAATEVAPGRIEVRLPSTGDGPPRVVEIVMSPNEWDQMAGTAWGDFDSAAQRVRNSLLKLEPGQRFLVYDGQYGLVGSTTPELPVDPDYARMNERARQHPEGFGHWVVLDLQGNVADKFRSPSD